MKVILCEMCGKIIRNSDDVKHVKVMPYKHNLTVDNISMFHVDMYNECVNKAFKLELEEEK